MIPSTSKRGRSVIAALGAIILLTASVAGAQTPAGQDPGKKYEKFLGNYEFDLSSLGGSFRTFVFFIKDGGFWIEYGFTSPGELKPVEGAADTFSFTDPDDGLCKLTFQKDEAGQYAKVRLVVESLKLDIVGKKKA